MCAHLKKKKIKSPEEELRKRENVLFCFFWLKSQLQHFNLKKKSKIRKIFLTKMIIFVQMKNRTGKYDCTVSPSNARVLLFNSLSTRYLFFFTFFIVVCQVVHTRFPYRHI